MRHHPRRLAAVAALAVMAGGLALSGPAAGAAAPYCGITWGSQAKQSGRGPTFPSSALTDVRVGEQSCYDRLVLDLNGPAAGYSVNYGTAVTEGQGVPVAVRGGAALNIVVAAPSTGVSHGDLANVAGFTTFRQVVGGGSFEGYTTIAVGVRARLPFRVFTLAGPGSGSRVVIDVANQW